MAEDTAQVNFKSGDEQEKHHAEGGNGLECDRKIAAGGKNKCVEIRPEMAEQGGAQQNAGHDFAEHGGLIELLHQLAG